MGRLEQVEVDERRGGMAAIDYDDALMDPSDVFFVTSPARGRHTLHNLQRAPSCRRLDES